MIHFLKFVLLGFICGAIGFTGAYYYLKEIMLEVLRERHIRGWQMATRAQSLLLEINATQVLTAPCKEQIRDFLKETVRELEERK